MKFQTLWLSRPVYEGLPWIYLVCGMFALVVSYGQQSRVISLLVGLPGFVGVLAGIVVLLKRRDSRAMREQYAQPDALADQADTNKS
jgi:hypothetical protein